MRNWNVWQEEEKAIALAADSNLDAVAKLAQAGYSRTQQQVAGLRKRFVETKPRKAAYAGLEACWLALDEYGPMTVRELSEVLGIDQNQTSKFVWRLHYDFLLVHICDWEPVYIGMKRHGHAAIFCAQPGTDLRKPVAISNTKSWGAHRYAEQKRRVSSVFELGMSPVMRKQKRLEGVL